MLVANQYANKHSQSQANHLSTLFIAIVNA